MRIRIELVQPHQVTVIKCSIENICSKSSPIKLFFDIVFSNAGIGQYQVLGIEYVLAKKKEYILLCMLLILKRNVDFCRYQI